MDKKFVKIFRQLVGVKSISTDPKYKKDIEKAKNLIVNYVKRAGLVVEVVRGFDNPIIIAKTPVNTKLETILVYGHYDVQPADLDLFNLKKKNNRFYGRGTADNKGQILIHLYSVIKLLRENKLGFNTIFLIEGNEETGSFELNKFLKKYKRILKSDCIIVSDSVLVSGNFATLQESFRGATSLEVILETAKDEMHSGLFGGVVPNAAEELGKIVGSLTDFVGKKNVYSANTKRYEKRRGLEATVEVTGFTSGYTDIGFKNSIPCKAIAKINVRSAPTQDLTKLVLKLKKFILSKSPKYVKVKFVDSIAMSGMKLDLNNKFTKRAGKILEEVYGGKLVIKNGGGTLPIAAGFRDILKSPQVLIPLANEDCDVHSASENMTIKAIKKGLEFSSRFFGNV